MERFPLRGHTFEKGFCQHCAEVADVLGADARKVALLDIVEDAFVGGWKAWRLHIDVKKVENRLALQGLLRQHEIDRIDEMKPYQLRRWFEKIGFG